MKREDHDMNAWTPEQLENIGTTDDFHISPYRADGITPGTPTWIWSVVVDGNVYDVRAYNGTASRWHRSAMVQRAGRVRAGGLDIEVSYTAVEGGINDRIDDAYSGKYGGSPYLPLMLSNRTRAATVRVDPR